MRKRRMGAMAFVRSNSLQLSSNGCKKRTVVEEIDGLLRVYEDGFVERPQIMPFVTCELAADCGVECKDMIVDKYTNLWARFYVPKRVQRKLIPLLVYFHGGGFCVGSASWSCYHEFLAKLASKVNSVVVSVNYRLAPENPLPAAYDDGVSTVSWLKKQYGVENNLWWTSKCSIRSIFLIGDSAGANIAYNVSTRVRNGDVKGLMLIQPFFGGESRTNSEKQMSLQPRSALTLAASDVYWRLSLPAGANRDHPWCNPMRSRFEEMKSLSTMVCISEMDILKDRNFEFCNKLENAGGKVEKMMYKGVGHAFQILNKSPLLVHEMLGHICNFVDSNQ